MNEKDKSSSDQQSNSLKNKVNSSDNFNLSESSNVQQQRSDATGLRRNLHGIIYQIKLVILFLQTAIDKNYTFELHSEKEDADKFDDIIFQYDKNGQYRFLQAKHKSNLENKITIDELLSENSKRPFNLKKYFNSLRKIEQNPQYKGKVRDLILCTNTDFKDDIKKERLIQVKKYDDILNIGEGKRYKLRLDKNKDIVQMLKDTYHEKIIYDKEQHRIEGAQLPNDSVIDNEIKQFFEKLIFAVEQPDEEKLGRLIQERTLNCLDDLKDDIQTELIYDYVENQILDWLKKPKSIALSNRDNFFKKGREKIREIMFHISHLEYSSCIKQLNINFISECKEITKLNKFLKSEDNILNLICFEENISISQVKVHQIRQQSGWRLKNLLNLKKYGNKVERLFNNDLLIIICKHEFQFRYEDMKDLYHELVESIKKDRNKKIILISGDILANFFQNGDLKNNYTEIIDNIRVEDLCPNYLQEKLLEKIIIFKGQETRLAHLINVENERLNTSELRKKEMWKLKSIIKPKILSELLFNTDIVVGNKLPDFEDPTSPYYDNYYLDIKRTYSHQVIEENSLQECVQKNREDLFVFHFTMRDYIMKNILVSAKEIEIKAFDRTIHSGIINQKFFQGRFFILSNENPEEDFSKLFDNCMGKSIHYLHYIGDSKFSVNYSNNLSNLRQFIKMQKLEGGKEIENNSVVIIIGDAGVGKSTILTSQHSRKLDPLSWFIRINLKDHQDDIKSANFEDLPGIIKFFYQTKLVGFETALAKRILKYYLIEYKDQVVLLLDGYDEIKECNKKKINQLLRFCRITERKIWLTTRLSEQYKIENALGTFAFSYFLNPLDEKEQEDFLKQLWIKKLNIKESDLEGKDCIDKFTKELLQHFHKLGFMKGDGFIGIVLRARMVAEIFHPKSKFNFSEVAINDISDLYEKFIEHQHRRYFKQKINIDINLLASQNTLTDSYETQTYLELNNMYLALNVLDDVKDKWFLRTQVHKIRHKFLLHKLNSNGIIKGIINLVMILIILYILIIIFTLNILWRCYNSEVKV